jgi:hypothetical protein
MPTPTHTWVGIFFYRGVVRLSLYRGLIQSLIIISGYTIAREQAKSMFNKTGSVL